jgi:phosphate transport system protein
MNEMTEGHTVEKYNSELEHLHQLVLKMGGLVQDQICRAVRTLEDEDVEQARLVVDRDQKIDQLDVQADEEIIRLIAKRQPVARDLREVLAVQKIVSDLERIGDQARRLARLTLLFYEGDNSPPNYRLINDIPKLSNLVAGMLESALTAFDKLDPMLALEVIRADAELDEEMRSALRRLSTYLMEDSRSVGHVVDIAIGLRAVERIGGHTKYIANHTIFLITGKDVRHNSLEEVTAEVMD